MTFLFLGGAAFAQHRIALGDWPEQRGPDRDGISKETNLPDKWAINGENFLWRAPYGGRSTPVVFGNRLYVQNPSGRGADEQERVMCLDPDTGKVIWQFKFNIFQSDAPAHRVGWASPAVDPETGSVYAIGAGGYMVALSRDGKEIWHRSIGEQFGAFTTHGGRMTSPMVDGNHVIVSLAVSTWGKASNRAQRLIALDKRSGDIVWVASPGGRPYDTAYAGMNIATINGLRLLIMGLGDGGVYAMKPATGERVWGKVIAKRGLNTSVVVNGSTVIISHGDENLDSTDRGMIAAIDGSQKGDIKDYKWAVRGFAGSFSSAIIDGDRVYQVDDGSNMVAFDITTGRELWKHQLGTVQKAPLVFADGKLYVGTESGKFFILKPHSDRVDILSDIDFPISKYSCCSEEGVPEQVLAGVAISRGRIFIVSSDAIYAIGSKRATAPKGFAVDEPAQTPDPTPAYVQVTPTELALNPGQTVKLHARLFDSKGVFIREATNATWSLDGLHGTVNDGTFVVAADPPEAAGTIKATVGNVSGEARAAVVHPLPWTETFEEYKDGDVPPGWINAAAGKFKVATLDGQKVLAKAPDETLFKRIRMFVGPTTWSNYTVEADVRANTKRRQMGDIGITAQTYSMILYGNEQALKIEAWEPEVQRTVTKPFEWKADQWYRLKLRVQNLPGGKVSIQGKVWPTGQPEPAQ
ncbi:MAG TPA: PQQ-binding-like beta-propeller repeat protein, partial [Bryobacteraceae bacterium]|nr:PQQ-binding-like beta-propeller repeat protein [Bryobacteraceae bacterium]